MTDKNWNLSLALIGAAILLGLTACGPEPQRVIRPGRPEPTVTANPPILPSIVDKIYDYGVVPELDGCTLKYVFTTNHPNFWFVRCPDGKVKTSYSTGGKNPTRINTEIE